MVWITCGLLCCFYHLFGLSFWRHPFTAEDPLVSKWCNVEFLQICSDEETTRWTVPLICWKVLFDSLFYSWLYPFSFSISKQAVQNATRICLLSKHRKRCEECTLLTKGNLFEDKQQWFSGFPYSWNVCHSQTSSHSLLTACLFIDYFGWIDGALQPRMLCTCSV